MKTPLVGAHPTLLRSAVVAIVVIWALRDVALLVGYSVLLAYALLPMVRAIERLRGPRGTYVPKIVAAGGVMLLLVGGLVWLAALAVPRVVSEAAHFAANAPEILSRLATDMHRYAAGHALGTWLDPTIARMRAQGPLDPERLATAIMTGVSGALGGVGNLLCLTLLPLLAFYLLADSGAVRSSTLRFIPEASRSEILKLGWAVDRALRSYVRGQAVVCLVTGLSVGIGLALMHHPAALLLGLLAGAAELIPYLGFLLAAGAIAFAGSGVSALQAVLGVSLYVSLNWAIGTFVTPRLMGRYLKMHPFVVTVSVLAGAKLLGPAGALLALPGAAVLQAIIGELAPAAVEAERVRSANAVAAGAEADETARSTS
jgi:predicted PurR-regulated permease PerM